MENQNLLSQRIEFLKNNIQQIIYKCTSSSDTEFIDTLNNKKKEYMNELETAMRDLKLSKDKTRKDNEYKKVMKINDSMEYYRIKNKPNSIELLGELKKKREKAQHDFEKMTYIEDMYSSKEQELCPDMPGFLFFHKDIINTYGMCTCIILTDNINNERLNWLDSQDDNGKLYRYLYDKYILKVEHNILLVQKEDLELYFNKLHRDYLSTSQINLLQLSEEYLKEYINSNVKTKKIKDKFKIIVNNISSIVIETGLNINEFISAYYGVYIPVNIRKDQENIELSSTGEFIITMYNDKFLEYKNILDSIEVSQRFINNSSNNLKQELYQYIYNQIHIKKVSLYQTGKYFKKWSELTDDEKLDRYHEYISHFIHKYLVEPGLIEGNDIETSINTVKNLITDNVKRLRFKDIKWNAKRGVIEQIYSLKFKEEDKSFYLKEKVDEKLQEESSSKPKTKKISSVKSSINKDTEKVINEDLVMYIIHLKKNKRLDADNLKTLKDEFLEKLKIKLHLKRITVNDKIQIFKTFDDIYSVITNNDSSSCG
jgi:hypothetical protein